MLRICFALINVSQPLSPSGFYKTAWYRLATAAYTAMGTGHDFNPVILDSPALSFITVWLHYSSR